MSFRKAIEIGLLSLAIEMWGCAGPAPSAPPAASAASERTVPGSSAAKAAPPAAAAPQSSLIPIVVATGPRRGTYHEFGRGIARLAAADLAATPLVTTGSVENLRKLAKGEAQVSLVNMGVAYEAWNGAGPWAEVGRMAQLRALFPLYGIPFHLVTKAHSAIESVRQLQGKRVGIGVGPAKGPGEGIFNDLVADMGLQVSLSVETPSELAEQLVSGNIDAIWLGAELPSQPLVELASREPVRLFGLNEEETGLVLKRYPHMTAFRIPAGTYAGQARPVATVALWNFAVASANLSSEAAYRLTRALLMRPAEAALALPGNWDRDLSLGTDTFLPYHSGAVRFYKENGIPVPAALDSAAPAPAR
jgi:uncharacterized protein